MEFSSSFYGIGPTQLLILSRIGRWFLEGGKQKYWERKTCVVLGGKLGQFVAGGRGRGVVRRGGLWGSLWWGGGGGAWCVSRSGLGGGGWGVQKKTLTAVDQDATTSGIREGSVQKGTSLREIAVTLFEAGGRAMKSRPRSNLWGGGGANTGEGHVKKRFSSEVRDPINRLLLEEKGGGSWDNHEDLTPSCRSGRKRASELVVRMCFWS